VEYRFWYISLPSSAKQQREMTKFKVLCRTCTPSLQSQLPDCSATLDRLNELKLSRRSLKYLEVFYKVKFSLALPSWLLKFPNPDWQRSIVARRVERKRCSYYLTVSLHLCSKTKSRGIRTRRPSVSRADPLYCDIFLSPLSHAPLHCSAITDYPVVILASIVNTTLEGTTYFLCMLSRCV